MAVQDECVAQVPTARRAGCLPTLCSALKSLPPPPPPWRPYHPAPEVSLLSGNAVLSFGVGLAGLFNLTGLDLHYSDCYGACDLPSRL